MVIGLQADLGSDLRQHTRARLSVTGAARAGLCGCALVPGCLLRGSVVGLTQNPPAGRCLLASPPVCFSLYITTATLQVRNSQFSGGQDARDFTFVTKGDIQQETHVLTLLLLQSEQGALSGQLQPGETLTTPTCTPGVISSKHSGDEAASVEVTVSETCRAIAYRQQSLQAAAAKLVRGRLTRPNTRYQLVGTIQITVRSVSIQNGNPTLTATLHGVGVYQINESQIKTLAAGKPRLTAIQLLQKLPGVQTVSITGISDNQQLPTDAAHIHLSIFYLAS